MNQNIVIYPKTSKMLLLGLASLLFVGVSVFMVMNAEEMELSSVLVIALSFLCIPFFSVGFIYTMYRTFHRKPSLVVDEGGITDNSSAISVGFVRWNDIKEMFLYEFMGQKFLGIVPKDEQAFFATMSPVKRRLMQVNNRMVKAPVNITQNTVSMPLEKVLEHAMYYFTLNDSY
jgi:hypothetical protein